MKIWIGLIILLGGLGKAQTLPHESHSRRSQLEELFIWKISEELKLSPDEEKKFSEAVRDLNKSKQSLHKQIEDATDELAKISAKPNSKDEIKKRLRLIKLKMTAFQKVSVKELDEVEKILGIERTAKYLEIKKQLTHKARDLLLQKDNAKPVLGSVAGSTNESATSSAATPAAPQVVEEK